MSPNGPFSGPPPQPWSGGGSDEPYTEPADPWSDHTTASGPVPWAGQQPPGPSGVDPAAPYGAPPEPVTWAPPPPRRRNTPIVALVVVLGLLIAGGLGTTAWLLLDRPDDDPGQTLPATTKPTSPTNVSEPEPSTDARFVKRGQCVQNQGSTQSPQMAIVPCAGGSFEVLRRIDGPTTGEADAEAKCGRVPSYTKWYFYDSELDSLDFVLCLRER